jgi:hypothetical protein
VRITSSKRAEAAQARAADEALVKKAAEDVRRERAAEEMRGRQESNMRNANQDEVAPVEELDTDLVSFLKMYGLAHLVELFAGEELDTQVTPRNKRNHMSHSHSFLSDFVRSHQFPLSPYFLSVRKTLLKSTCRHATYRG